MSAVANVENLTKNYQMEEVVVPALHGVSLSFEEGDFIALMGPSGSGKSTLLNLLGCLDRSSSGQYYLGGDDVSQMEDDQLSEVRSKYIGFIFQSYNLLPQYTVVENIEIPLLYQGMQTGWNSNTPASRSHRPGRWHGRAGELAWTAARRNSPAASSKRVRHRPVAGERPAHHPRRRADAGNLDSASPRATRRCACCASSTRRARPSSWSLTRPTSPPGPGE